MASSRFSEVFGGSNRPGTGAGWGRFGVFRGIHDYDPDQPRVPKGYSEGGEWTRVAADAPPEGSREGPSRRVDIPPSKQSSSNPAGTDDASTAKSPASSFWDTPLPYWDGMSPATYGTMTPRNQALGSLASLFVPLAVLGGAQALGGAVATGSVWRLGWALRGVRIERALGKTTPDGFPVIDRFVGRVATSIKSMDLNAPAYQNVARITSRLNAYVDALANFEGAKYADQVIEASEIMV